MKGCSKMSTFENIEENNLLISEIFYSIQGEGINLGQPSIFVRTAGCTLKCSYCDSLYAVDFEKYNFNKEVKKYTIQEAFKILTDLMKEKNCRNLVITGGEPLLQQDKLTDLLIMIDNVEDMFSVEIETNGTIKPIKEFDSFVDQYNISPKLSNSMNPAPKRKLNEFFIRNNKFAYKFIYKFVIINKEDIKEVLELIDLYSIPNSKVILMPEGVTKEELIEKSQFIIEECKKYNFRFTPRLHIDIYGQKRSV